MFRHHSIRILLLLLMSTLAHAAGGAAWNSAAVPVMDNSQAEFDKGVAAALQRVIVRLTGDSRTLGTAGAKALLAQAGRYNTAFGYLQGADGKLNLRADFDLLAVSGALRGRGFKVWGKDRPQIATWLAVAEPDGGYTLRPRETNQSIFNAMSQLAEERVIALHRLVPDASTVTLVQQAADDEALQNNLLTAATDTKAPAGLVILIKQSEPATWHALCRLMVDGETFSWADQDSSAETLAARALGHAQDEVSHHFAKLEVAVGNDGVELTVTGIQTVDDYGKAYSYLAGLDVVTKIDVRKVSGNDVLFVLQARGGMTALAQGISFGSVLAPVPESPTTYTWK